MNRHDLRFPSGADACAAWFYPAAGQLPSAPVVVMAHGLSGTRRDRLGPFAERFAAAGVAALLFDHRGFGDSGGEPDLFHPARQLDDWRAPFGELRTYAGVDHFDIYDGPAHAAVIAAEVEFLRRQLLRAAITPPSERGTVAARSSGWSP